MYFMKQKFVNFAQITGPLPRNPQMMLEQKIHCHAANNYHARCDDAQPDIKLMVLNNWQEFFKTNEFILQIQNPNVDDGIDAKHHSTEFTIWSPLPKWATQTYQCTCDFVQPHTHGANPFKQPLYNGNLAFFLCLLTIHAAVGSVDRAIGKSFVRLRWYHCCVFRRTKQIDDRVSIIGIDADIRVVTITGIKQKIE